MEKDIIIHGIRVAGYEFIPEKIKELIKTRCIDKGMNYIDFAFGQQEIPEEYFLDIAKFLKKTKCISMSTSSIRQETRAARSKRLADIPKKPHLR